MPRPSKTKAQIKKDKETKPPTTNVLKGVAYYSRREAAGILEMHFHTVTSKHQDGELVGIELGDGDAVGGPTVYVYTGSMLDDYKAGKRPVLPPSNPNHQLLTLGEVMKTLGLTYATVRKLVRLGKIPTAIVGGERGNRIYRRDVIAQAAREYGRAVFRNKPKDESAPDNVTDAYWYDIETEEERSVNVKGLVQQAMEKTGKSPKELANDVPFMHRQTIQGILDGRTNDTIPIKSIYALMEIVEDTDAN